jgi:hypothetical protein
MSIIPGCEGAGAIGDIYYAAKDVSEMGKAENFVLAPWDQALDSARATAVRFNLTPVKEETHPEQRKLIYKDDRNQEIFITVIRRTESVTEVKVDVSLLGPENFAKLFLQEMVKPLPASAPAEATSQNAPKPEY